MDPTQLETLITIAGAILVLTAIGGGAFVAAVELRLRNVRRLRLQPAVAGAPQPARPKDLGIG